MTWDDIANEEGTDKGTVGHGYMGCYEEILDGVDVRSILEIGVQGGRSLRTWARIFPQAQVMGLEIDPAQRYDDPPRVFTVVCDATKVNVAQGSEWDLIIDDGSHVPEDVAEAWRRLWPHVRPGGVYVVEDVTFQVPGVMLPHGQTWHPLLRCWTKRRTVPGR